MTLAHMVCRDCDAEGLEEPDLAHDLAEGHADKHGHRVEVEEVESR